METPVTTTDQQEKATPAEPTNGPIGRARSIRIFPVAALAFMVGAALLYLGAPRAIEAVWMYSGNRTMLDIQAQEGVSNEKLADLIEALNDSMFLMESGRKRTDLGLAQLLLSARTEDEPEAQELLVRARESLRKGLALAPANGFAWTRLAYVETLISGPSKEIAGILQMAMLTMPFEPQLLLFRLELCFFAWPYFDEENQNLVYEQVRYAWHDSATQLVELAARAERVELVRDALASTPEELDRFETLLEKGAS